MPSTQWTHEEEEDSRPKWRELACISPRDCGMYLKLQSVMWGTINSRTTSSKRLNNEWWRCITKSQQKLGWEMLHHHNWIEIGAQYLQATGTRVLHCSSCKQCKRKRWTRSDNIVLMMSLLAICRNASSVWLLCKRVIDVTFKVSVLCQKISSCDSIRDLLYCCALLSSDVLLRLLWDIQEDICTI